MTQPDPRARRLGRLGILSRAVLGLWFVGSVAIGHLTGAFHPLPWALGLIVLPQLVLLWHWWRARQHTGRLEATGPVAHIANVVLFVAMLVMPRYVPALAFTADTALLFYGSAMLVAAARRQADCEVLAYSNWLLRRDDRVGCLPFAPIDRLDRCTFA